MALDVAAEAAAAIGRTRATAMRATECVRSTKLGMVGAARCARCAYAYCSGAVPEVRGTQAPASGGGTRRGGDTTNSNLWCVWWTGG